MLNASVNGESGIVYASERLTSLEDIRARLASRANDFDLVEALQALLDERIDALRGELDL